MFKSLALGSVSVASVPASKSSAASSYDSSSKSDKWENVLTKMNLEINKLTRYEISCMNDGSEGQGWAEFGISVLNFFGGDFDYPDHWFLIAETKPKNFFKEILGVITLGSIFAPLLEKLKHVDTTAEKKKEVKKVDINEYFGKILKVIILFLDSRNKDKEKNPFKDLHEIYGKEIMEDIVKKLKDIKDMKDIQNLLKNLDSEKYTKVFYFLIEKGGNGKTVQYYKNVQDILDEESENYNYNECNPKEVYYMKSKTTIKDLKKYVETLSDSYNLIDDNCQDFVRNILKHYNLE